VQLDMFKNYKPDVNIVYYDEYGHLLTPRLRNMRTDSESNGRLVHSWICSRTTSLTLTLFIMMSMVVRSPQDSGIRELTLRAMGGSCAAGFVQELQAWH
jgi:hypothetical protein